jgi:hypothetical protein
MNEVQVFCEYCARPFEVSRADYDNHDNFFCSEPSEAASFA